MAANMAHEQGLQGLKVLLVDDNRDGATAMARLLASFGCQASTCFDGGSALASAEQAAPHVMILDLRLPDVPGTEVCSRLRATPGFDSTLLVALTGATDQGTLDRARQCGFDRVLAKPVDLDDLLGLLKSVIPAA